MSSRIRVLTLALLLPLAGVAVAAGEAGEQDQGSYVVGLDTAGQLNDIAPDLDLGVFESALADALAGKPPALDAAQAQETATALAQRIAARKGARIPGLPPGSEPPAVDPVKVAQMVGADVGRSLAPMRSEIEFDALMRGMRDSLQGRAPELDEAAIEQAREGLQARLRARAASAADDNRQAGIEFMSANRDKPGVFATASGIQYSVERQGQGPRPRSGDRVRVHYRGTLLDGTEFDSSYARGEPAVFGLDQVIAGWTEGLQLMPIGAKYRFWIPGELAYGVRGSPPNIPPNSTLVFDVELIDIL